MKLKKPLELYKGSVDYLENHEVFMLKDTIDGDFPLYKERTLTVSKIYQDWSGLTVWMIDSMNKKHVINEDQFRKMIKIC
jgi:hypothetical protein